MTTSSRQEFLSPDSRYVLPVKFGLGGVPLGNEFEVVSDEDAYKTLEAAWNAGVRYYDVSPWYGLGLAERRYGNFLHNKNRDDYVLSSKVGKLLKASPHNNAPIPPEFWAELKRQNLIEQNAPTPTASRS